MKDHITNTELSCGCRYVHRKGKSQYKFWIRCEEAERLWDRFKQDMSVQNRTKYDEHFQRYSHTHFEPLQVNGVDLIRFRVRFDKRDKSEQLYNWIKKERFEHLESLQFKHEPFEFIGHYHKPIGILILNYINDTK